VRFKKLELVGFKSFAEPTEILFEPGVTAVVGPNGCGKCLAGSQELLAADGQRWMIGELVESTLQQASQTVSLDDGVYTTENPSGISVLSLNPQTFKLEPRPIAAFIKRTAPAFLLKIQTKSGRQVIATPYHPLFTLHHGQLQALRADEVTVGIKIATPRTLTFAPPNKQTAVGDVLKAFSSEDQIYVPYSEQLREFICRMAKRYGGLANLEKAEGLPINSLRGVRSRQAINVAYAAVLVRLEGRSWSEESPAVLLKSKGSGQVRIPRVANRALARFLGYLVAEGRNTSSNQVWFVNEDREIVADFRRSAHEAFGVEAKVFSYKGNTKDVIIFSRALCAALHRLYSFPINSKSAEKRIPQQIMAAPKEIAAEFISALFEGDAYLSDRGSMQYIEYSTASEHLAHDLLTLLLRFGVTALCRTKTKYASNAKKRTRRLYYSVYIYGTGNLKTLAVNLRFVGVKQKALRHFQETDREANPNLDLVPGITPLVRHLTKTAGLRVKTLRSESPRLAAYSEGRCEASRIGIAEVTDFVSRYGTQTSETVAISKHLQQLAASDLYWDEIVAVEQVPPEGPWVYDLSIAETHNFVAQNIVVHNSNVADAIKWVLGEQSARELRGGRMEDLIFNGSDRRDPIHYAEVSLTLDNSEKQLPIEYSEVTISRRLFRSGESEYLLNGTGVRLKDVQELLMGSGIGTSAYSLFEQGRIEQIINARPEDRRAVFEEAAGITRFKSQKREALRKLDETEANLLRITDVIAEVKRQIQALERQVRRARVYQEQFEELKSLELKSARQDLTRLSAQAAVKESALQELRRQVAELEAELQGHEARLQEARQGVTQADQFLAQAREAHLAVIHQQQTLRHRLEVNRERIEESQIRQETITREIAAAETQTLRYKQQLTELSVLLAQADAERQAKEEQVHAHETRLAQCARIMSEAEREIAQARERLLEKTGEQVKLKNQLLRAQQEVHQLEARVSRLQTEGTKVTAEQAEAGQRLQFLQQALLQAKAAVDQITAERATAQETLAAAEARSSQAQENVIRLGSELTRISSQVELLKGLIASHDGYSGGVRALLTAMEQGRLSSDGINGVLAELIQVKDEDRAAVDAALGTWAEAVVVESATVADRCRLFLEQTKAGRVLFLMRDQVPQMPAPTPVSIPGASPLFDRIGITPHLEPLLRLLLADTWLVSDKTESTASLSSRFVTPAGELFTMVGALLGATPSEEGMVVGRKGRLESLEITAAHLSKELEQAKERLAAAHGEQQMHAQAVTALESRLQERFQELHRSEATCSSAESALNQLGREHTLLAAELNESGSELARVRANFNQLQTQAESAEQELNQLQAVIQQAQGEIAQAAKDREETSVALATVRSELNSFDHVVASRRASLQVLEQTLEASAARVTSQREEMERLTGIKTQWESACIELESALSTMAQEELRAAEKVTEEESRKAQALERAQVQERSWMVQAKRVEEFQAQIHAQAMEQAQLHFQREQIGNRLVQVYQVNLEEVTADTQQEETAQEWNPEEVRARMEELSIKLQRMGPVNLASIDEERELQTRYEHLVTQQGDLTQAKEDLHQAITKINRTTRAMFRETFEAIQKEFQVTYKQLFGGGEARLMLLDEEDILESGVEIIARPPGKQLQAISLLSGGEKALTTIALLFAIFRVKPSPFCLLDEIDAPLDEANVGRFTQALREFLKESQFIIITHNKKTISMADVMYGITMAESGVSKVVSVKFKPAEENGNGSAVPSQVPHHQPDPQQN